MPPRSPGTHPLRPTGQANFSALTLGAVCGVVRVENELSEAALAKYGPEDIVVLPSVPNDIQAVAALVTQQMQTPLCHVALLCANRQTPNMMLRGPLLSELLRHEGTPVFLSVRADAFRVEALAA